MKAEDLGTPWESTALISWTNWDRDHMELFIKEKKRNPEKQLQLNK